MRWSLACSPQKTTCRLRSMAVTLWVLWAALVTDRAVPDWAQVVPPMCYLGRLQLLVTLYPCQSRSEMEISGW